jgi:hypothetical protein
MERQKAFALLQLFIEVVITLFIAGLVAPSVVRYELATNQVLAARALRTMHIAGMAFSYAYQNVAAAILGGLVGAMAACAIHFRSGRPMEKTSGRAIRRARTDLCGGRSEMVVPTATVISSPVGLRSNALAVSDQSM